MSNIVLLLLCLLIGMALRRAGRIPADGHLALNAFVVHVALPALIVGQIHTVRLTPDLLLPVSMPWVLFALTAGLMLGLGRAMRWPIRVSGALILTAGLANTSFVGLPMIETFYGREQLATGILIDQLGTYLVLSTLGVAVASIASAGSTSWRAIARRVVTFPPLIALVVALATSPLNYPPWLDTVLHRLGDTLAPVALVSVGLQLRPGEVAGHRLALSVGLGVKLVFGPLLIALLYLGALSWSGPTARVTVFEAAMGPQIGAGIIAMQYGLSPSLITLMIGLGVILSFATLPLWYLGLTLT